jgi:hypothetical protein
LHLTFRVEFCQGFCCVLPYDLFSLYRKGFLRKPYLVVQSSRIGNPTYCWQSITANPKEPLSNKPWISPA